MSPKEIKDLLNEIIDQNADEIISIGEAVLNNPELGYKEEKTSRLVRNWFEKLSIDYQYPFGITGVKGTLNCNNADEGVNICIIGELDAVKSSEHKNADLATGAAHACGHNTQIATMLGVAIALKNCGFFESLNGRVTFFAVPAEEFAEIEYRQRLKNSGAIEYFGGKQQLIFEAAFDDIDIAMMIHSQAKTPEGKLYLDGSSLGFVAKTVKLIGKEAHGGEPFDGVNALNAAMLALMNIHANRETFRDEDKIRIHPIITNGGELVNTVPAEVTIETYVRGANIDAIKDACNKVDRSIMGASMAIGATAEINNISGYLPLKQDENLSRVFEDNAVKLIGEENIYHGIDMVGSTDMGDLSHLIPCLHACMGGYSGVAHSKDFLIADKNAAYINTVKLLAMTIVDLLCENAKLGKKIKSEFKPKLTRYEYITYLKGDK